MTPFELGRLLVEKRAEKPLPSQDYQAVLAGEPNFDSPATQRYIDLAKKQYYEPTQPPHIVAQLAQRDLHNNRFDAGQKRWQDYVKAHPVYDNFEEPKHGVGILTGSRLYESELALSRAKARQAQEAQQAQQAQEPATPFRFPEEQRNRALSGLFNKALNTVKKENDRLQQQALQQNPQAAAAVAKAKQMEEEARAKSSAPPVSNPAVPPPATSPPAPNPTTGTNNYGAYLKNPYVLGGLGLGALGLGGYGLYRYLNSGKNKKLQQKEAAMTPFELGRLSVEKRAEKPLPSQDYQAVPPNIDDDMKAIIEAFRRASLKSMGLRANTKVKIDTEPEEFIISAHPLFGTRVKPVLKKAAMTPFELGRMGAIEKLAYGGGDTGYEYGRWLDGGFPFDDKPFDQSRQRIIDMTKTLSDAAKARGAAVKFYGNRYDDPTNGYSADEAVKRLMAAKEINDTNESSMPNYYFMDYPRKPRSGLAELLRLKTPAYMEHDEAFPAGTHPLEVIHDKYFKKPKTDASQKQAGLPIVYTLREIASRLMGRGGVAYEAKMKKKKEREEANKMQESNKIENPIEEVKTAFELGALTVKKAAKKPGLWDNIHAKRERGETPAKPGDKDYPDQKSWNATVKASGDAWQRAEGKNPEGGLNAKGRASLKAEGQDIKPPVTEDKPTGERADRKASFCARMGGMKKKLTSSETANDPDSRINKALRKWNC